MKSVKWLSAGQINDLVTGYLAGSTTNELAVRFGVHQHTITRQLRNKNIKFRPTSLTPAQIEAAVQLYGQGMSLAQIGTQFGRDARTIHRALRRAGVTFRDSHGRDRIAQAAR